MTGQVTRLPQRPSLEVSAELIEDRPCVRLRVGATTLELGAGEAERIALELLRAVRTAEFDAFIIGWLSSSKHFPHREDAEALLALFRDYRLEHTEPRRARRNGAT